MTKLITAMIALFICSGANAQSWGERAESFRDMFSDGSNTVRLMAGAQSAANHYGIDYEFRSGPVGIGAFYIQGNESSAVARPEFMTIGFVAPIHLIDKSRWDLYIAPGVNMTQFKDYIAPSEVDEDDYTTWGAVLKMGMMYYFNNHWHLGLDFVKIHNANESQITDEDDILQLAVGYTW